MKYRKKPFEVEAFRIGFDQCPSWASYESAGTPDVFFVYIGSYEYTKVNLGSWVINANGKLIIMSEERFITTYEAVE